MRTKPLTTDLLNNPVTHLFRYEDHRVGGRIQLDLLIYRVVRETPKGYRAQRVSAVGAAIRSAHQYWSPEEHWVSATAKKWRAYLTKLEALYAYYRRKDRQVAILQSKLDHAKMARLAKPKWPVADPNFVGYDCW